MRTFQNMAGRLLLGILMVSALQACLLPQDGNVLPIVDSTTPPKKNRPPYIEKFDPAQTVFVVPNSMNGANCPTQFTVTVRDPDGDPIRSLWFIDPNSTYTTDSSHLPPLIGTKKIATPTGVGITSPTGLSQLADPPSTPGAPHVLTVWLSDGEFTSPGQPIFFDGGTSGSGIEIDPHSTFFLPDGGGCDAAGNPCVDPSYRVSQTWNVYLLTTGCP